MNQLVVHHSISELEPGQWDRLTGGNVLASQGWLKTIEESLIDPVTPTYICLYGENGLDAARGIRQTSENESRNEREAADKARQPP